MLRICAAFVLALLPLAVVADPSGRIGVVDADTWDVGSTRVRLFGIDAPEVKQTCADPRGKEWPCGDWATGQVRERYQGQEAVCEAVDSDRYGRTVARCRVEGQDVARQMVQDGWALAFRRYSLDYDLDEKTAHVAGVGIHGGGMMRPAAFRAQPVQAVGDCPIKGNISSKGERIFHLPGQEHYDRTRISPGKGERWFCSESEARAAGWRRARR
ncbi:MAG: thermonuclease family protein [Pseudooceanicola sp.]|nr:thermonuclease family protein [Pseudooceanicola sp.]